MEFCAPFFAVNHFNWTGADLVTVLRNPVDRVWSMYRFQTMSCYKCLPLKEIYNRIDNGTTEGEILFRFSYQLVLLRASLLFRIILTIIPFCIHLILCNSNMWRM